MYYEIPLYWSDGKLTVHTDRGSLGEGWKPESDLLHEIANGGAIEKITEHDLPGPLYNPIYRNLEIYRLGNRDNFAAIAEL